jgi:hypothetical protein
MSGGVAAFTYARKLARDRTCRSNRGYADASRSEIALRPAAVLSASAQNVIPLPSAWGAYIRTAGSISSRPWEASLRSFMTDARRRPTV